MPTNHPTDRQTDRPDHNLIQIYVNGIPYFFYFQDSLDFEMAYRQHSESPGWEKMQVKTFTKWVKTRLQLAGKRDIAFENLLSDLTTGTVLCELIEVLRKKGKVRYTKLPRTVFAMRDNVDTMLKLLDVDRVKHINIGAGDIVDGNRMLTLGLIWILILNYDIMDQYVESYVEDEVNVKSKSKWGSEILRKISSRKTSTTKRFSIRDVVEMMKGTSPMQLVLNDVNIKLEPYEIKVKNFSRDFADGRALSALVDRHRPGFFNAVKEKSDKERVEESIATGKTLGIEDLVEPEDVLMLASVKDEIGSSRNNFAMLTYIKCYLRTDLDHVLIPYTDSNWGDYHKKRRISAIIPSLRGEVKSAPVSPQLNTSPPRDTPKRASVGSGPTSPLLRRLMGDEEARKKNGLAGPESPLAKASPSQPEPPRRDSLKTSVKVRIPSHISEDNEDSAVFTHETQASSIIWINSKLRDAKKKSQINNVRKDVQSGVLLCELMEAIKGKTVSFNKNPKIIPHKAANINVALSMMRADGVIISNISAKDITDGNPQLTRALLWDIAMFYMKQEYILEDSPSQRRGKRRLTISELEKRGINPDDHLIKRLNIYLGPRNATVANLSKDWNDGIALSILIDRCIPGFHEYHKVLDVNVRLEKCMAYAETYLKIDRLISLKDFRNPKVNTIIMTTYLSRFDDSRLINISIPYSYVPTLKPVDKFIVIRNTNSILKRFYTIIRNYDRDFIDGKVLSAIIDSRIPGFYKANMTNTPKNRIITCLDFANKHLGIPITLNVNQLLKGEVAPMTMAVFVNEIIKPGTTEIINLSDIKESFTPIILMRRVNARIHTYGLTLKVPSKDLSDGVILIALLNNNIPGLYTKYYHQDPETRMNVCFKIMTNVLNIPVRISPSDLIAGKATDDEVNELLAEVVSLRTVLVRIPVEELDSTLNVKHTYREHKSFAITPPARVKLRKVKLDQEPQPQPGSSCIPGTITTTQYIIVDREVEKDVTVTKVTLSELQRKGIPYQGIILANINKIILPYGVQVQDYGPSWYDGRALAALVDQKIPGFWDQKADYKDRELLEASMNAAEETLDYPRLVNIEDIFDDKKPKDDFLSYLVLFLQEDVSDEQPLKTEDIATEDDEPKNMDLYKVSAVPPKIVAPMDVKALQSIPISKENEEDIQDVIVPETFGAVQSTPMKTSSGNNTESSDEDSSSVHKQDLDDMSYERPEDIIFENIDEPSTETNQEYFVSITDVAPKAKDETTSRTSAAASQNDYKSFQTPNIVKTLKDSIDKVKTLPAESSDNSEKPEIKSEKDEPSHSDSSHKYSKFEKSLKKASDKEESSKSSNSTSCYSSSDHSSKSHTSHGSKQSPEPELDLKLSSKESDNGHDSDTSGDIIPETVDKVESRPDEVDRRPSSGDELSDKSDKPAIKSDKDEPSHSDSSHKSSKSGKSLKKASDKEGSSKSSSSSSSSSSSDHSSKSHTSHGSKKSPSNQSWILNCHQKILTMVMILIQVETLFLKP